MKRKHPMTRPAYYLVRAALAVLLVKWAFEDWK